MIQPTDVTLIQFCNTNSFIITFISPYWPFSQYTVNVFVGRYFPIFLYRKKLFGCNVEMVSKHSAADVSVALQLSSYCWKQCLFCEEGVILIQLTCSMYLVVLVILIQSHHPASINVQICTVLEQMSIQNWHTGTSYDPEQSFISQIMMASCRLATTYEQAKRANLYSIYALIKPYKRTVSFQFHNNDISFISTNLNYA